MSKKIELYSRLLRFMIAVHNKSPKLWISRDNLKYSSFKEGYKSKTIWSAFEMLDNNVQIGKIFDGVVRYHYYNIPKDEARFLQDSINYFDKN